GTGIASHVAQIEDLAILYACVGQGGADGNWRCARDGERPGRRHRATPLLSAQAGDARHILTYRRGGRPSDVDALAPADDCHPAPAVEHRGPRPSVLMRPGLDVRVVPGDVVVPSRVHRARDAAKQTGIPVAIAEETQGGRVPLLFQ